ncbi:protein cholesin isoform X1 [Aquarana catesbeiana]|uniref:protein cholesin isoform X1 n=2 Tax=Aquarana catesbeiana TaxID=8400 RepID=UPI003CCA5073
MAKNKTKSSEKKEKKKTISESSVEVPKAKKKKLNPKVSEDPDSLISKEEGQNNLNIEDLTPEERRVLERKLKKERKKEEKKLKKEKGLAEEKKEEPSKPSGTDLALQYLESWSKKHEWKFQKTRQTWLLMNMYDQEKVPDKYFHIMLDYLGGLKGSARETTIQKAEAYMKECDSDETQEEANSQRRERIREVLQLLS